MPDISFRSLPQADVAIAREMRAAMVRELNGTDPDVTHPGWRDRYVAFYREIIGEGRGALYLAESGPEAVGVAAVYLVRNHRTEIFHAPSAYVSNVWVDPAWRRRGIAARLMRMTVQWARERGCEVIRLRSSAVGRPLYSSLGFTATDEMEMRL